jgi:hypothetical protein
MNYFLWKSLSSLPIVLKPLKQDTMAQQNQNQAQQKSNVNLIIIGKMRKVLIGKGLLIAMCASLVLPACKSHKLCEAYSDSRIQKNHKSGPAFSLNQTSKVHSNHL